MNYSSEQINTIAATLKQVVTDKNIKLRWGAVKRQQMHLGMETDTYRMEWIRKSRIRVIGLLSLIADEFNKTWRHDQASVGDLIDICEDVYDTLESRVKKS